MKTLYKVVAQVMNVSTARISDKTSPQNTKKWDSLRGLLLVTALENQYKIKFTTQDMAGMKNIGDIKKILKKRGVKLKE